MQTHSMPYHELLAASARPDPTEPVACPVCRLVRRALLLWIEDLVYSFGVDPAVRREVRLARGLCNRHEHLLTEIRGMALGVSLIHLDVIDTMLDELAKGLDAARLQSDSSFDLRSLFDRLRHRASATPVVGAIQAALRPRRTCLACEHQAQVEELYLRTLLRHLDEDELAAALRNSPGLCLPHFYQSAELAEDDVNLRLLADIQQICARRLRDDLAEFARKNDHRHLNERVGTEADAWTRSINQLTGLRGIR